MNLLEINVRPEDVTSEVLEILKEIITAFPGACPVYLLVSSPAGQTRTNLNRSVDMDDKDFQATILDFVMLLQERHASGIGLMPNPLGVGPI